MNHLKREFLRLRFLATAGLTLVVMTGFQNCTPIASVQSGELASVDSPGIAPTNEPSNEPLLSMASPDVSNLLFDKVFTAQVPDCFPAQNRPAIVQDTYDFKHQITPNGIPFKLKAYVHYPPNRDMNRKYPVVAMFHGGGWSGGNPTYWFPMAFYFAARGVVTISFEYRVRGVHGSIPEDSVADAVSAVRWIRKNANALGVDGQKILATGDSAGGHLALSTALTKLGEEKGPDALAYRPNALAVFYPVIDTTTPTMQATFPTSNFLALSPKHLMSSKNVLPPTLIIQGSADDIGLIKPPNATADVASGAFCDSANAVSGGTVCWHVPFMNYIHSFLDNYCGWPTTDPGHTQDPALPYRLGMTYLDSFLIDLGYLSGTKSQLQSWVTNSAPHCNVLDIPTYCVRTRLYGFSTLGMGCPAP